MKQVPPECHVFGAEKLLPEGWQRFTVDGPIRTFNPGLVRDGAGWLFAYRIVAVDGLRRIGICRLDASFNVIAGSAVPLTDLVRFRPDATYPEIATKWFADPRLYRFGGRLFVYWNSGWHEPQNFQFVQELGPTTLLPRGHARELVLRGERRKLEKNWTFFAAGSDQYRAVYSVTPHRILQFSIAGDGDIVFDECSSIDWTHADYPANHGGLRGGSPPCLAHERFWSFCHTVHDGPDGYRYLPAAYSFEAKHPFAPVSQPISPLKLGNPNGATRSHPRLNPAVADVVYPCGAALDGARWVISHGINDEICAISIVEHAAVVQTQRPVALAGS